MKFSPLQLSFVMILFVGISSHVLVLPDLLETAYRDSWVCGLISYVILICWGIMIYFILLKMNGQKLFYWIKDRAGGAVSGIIVFLLFIYILFIGLTSFYELILSVKIYLLPNTYISFLAVSFLLLCLGVINGEFKTIVYMSAIMLPVVWILGMYVGFSSINDKEYSFLLPVFIHSYEPIVNGLPLH